MNIFEIVLYVIYIAICVIHVLKRPLLTLDIVGGKTYFEWTSFWWFLLGLATFINLVYKVVI